MYDFHDMQTVSNNVPTSSHQLIYNGVNFDEVFTTDTTSFVTLSVTGRGLAQRKHTVVEQDGIDGGMTEGINYLPRSLTVKVKVSASTDDAFRTLIEDINLKLFTRYDVDIQFTDEVFKYQGHFLTSTEPEELKNEQVLELNFYCGNPFKLNAEKSVTVASGGRIEIDSHFPVRPYIDMTFDTAQKVVTISNTTTGQVLKIDSTVGKTKWAVQLYGEPVSNDSVINKNHLKYMPLDSDFRDFTIDTGDRVVVQPAPSLLTFKYEGVKL